MYVCICQAVSDETLREEIRNGATSVKALTKKLGLGSGCAKCVGEIKALIKQTLSEDTSVNLAFEGIKRPPFNTTLA